MAFQTVCKVGDIADGQSKCFNVGDKVVAVFHVGGAYHAIDDMCPHMGASLSDGHVEDGVVTCPWHAWSFRLEDGTWMENRRLKIGCYQVRVEGDFVQVEVPEKPAA